MPVGNEVHYIEARYWDGHSSAYGTGDQLLGLLRANWQIATIGRVTRFHRGRRFTTYMFELTNHNHMTVMIVVENPFIHRLVDRRLQQHIWDEQGISYASNEDEIEMVTMKRRALAY